MLTWKQRDGKLYARIGPVCMMVDPTPDSGTCDWRCWWGVPNDGVYMCGPEVCSAAQGGCAEDPETGKQRCLTQATNWITEWAEVLADDGG